MSKQSIKSEPAGLLHPFLSALKQPALILNQDGIVLDCNEALTLLYACSCLDVLKKNYFDYCKIIIYQRLQTQFLY